MAGIGVIGIGVIGTGDIAPRYLAGLAGCRALHLAGIASRDPARAAPLAARFGTQASNLEALIADPAVDVVVNLSAPLEHAAITRAALAAGKHVYSEKPLAASVVQAEALIALARHHARVLAAAPATYLGPRHQQARRILATGQLGTIVGGSATMVYRGPDLWHHNPAALFGMAAGPLYDMGVYDVAALIDLLGPVQRVTGFGRQLQAQRVVQQGPAAGTRFSVSTPTHVTALLQFVAGPLITLTCSFDGLGSAAPGLQLIGTQACLRAGHSSRFEGELSLSTRMGQWEAVPAETDGWADDLWIIGLLDMVAAIEDDLQPRCSADSALHQLAVLEAILLAIDTGTVVDVAHPVDPAPLLSAGWMAHIRERFGLHQDPTP